MFSFMAQIQISFKDKNWNEVCSFEKLVVEDLKKMVPAKYNPGIYLHAKSMNFKIYIPHADQKDLDSFGGGKKSFLITPRLDDYDLIINLLAAIRKWYNECDREIYGNHIRVSVSSNAFGDSLFLTDGKYIPSLTRRSLGNVSEELQKGIDAFNNDIDSVKLLQ